MEGKSLPPNKRTSPSRSTQFSIDLDVKGLIVFLVMVALTAATVFYLGVFYGKSTRDPNQDPVPQSATPAEGTSAEGAVAIDRLNIYDIRDENKSLEQLRRDSQRTLERADALIQGTETAPTPARPAVKPAVAPSAQSENGEDFTPSWPDGQATGDGQTTLYSVQVLATRNLENANRIVLELKKKGYNAFVTEVTIENHKMYRVRVGRKPRNEIDALKNELEKVVAGIDSRPRIVRAD
jgi:cell division septation protein DedD